LILQIEKSILEKKFEKNPIFREKTAKKTVKFLYPITLYTQDSQRLQIYQR